MVVGPLPASARRPRCPAVSMVSVSSSAVGTRDGRDLVKMEEEEEYL
jgi:hypothetical protein